MPTLKLTVFDCGELIFADVSPFGLSNEETAVRELFVPCYLIQHDEHLMVWDAGLPLTDVGQTSGNSRYEKSFLDQLAEMDIAPSDIDLVAFSHMHYDHVGAANAFTDSTLLIQETEAVAAFEHPEDNPVFREELYNELRNTNRRILNGDYDVFGDGSVRIIAAPGHTPGHQVLYLDLDNYGPLILSGDLYHFEASRALRRVPVLQYQRRGHIELYGQNRGVVDIERSNFLDRAQQATCRESKFSARVLRLNRYELSEQPIKMGSE